MFFIQSIHYLTLLVLSISPTTQSIRHYPLFSAEPVQHYSLLLTHTLMRSLSLPLSHSQAQSVLGWSPIEFDATLETRTMPVFEGTVITYFYKMKCVEIYLNTMLIIAIWISTTSNFCNI